MLTFGKKTTIAASGILVGTTDHHSHILPGVDDGVETMDEALRILDAYEAMGIKELWLTPHIMEDIPNTPEKLKTRFAELQAAYNGNIELHLAAEYMIDNHLHKLLQDYHFEPNGETSPTKNCPSCVRGTSEAEGDDNTQNFPSLQRGAVRNNSTACDDGCFSTPKESTLGLTQGEGDNTNKLLHSLEGRWHELSEVTEGNQTNNCPSYIRGASDAVAEGVETNKLLPIGSADKHILVETSYFTPPMRLHETLRKIKSLGYYPILAHPERYMYMEKEEYLELHEEGIKFQLNLASLAGGYGKAVKKKAEWLLKKELYSVAGSDLHREDAIEFIKGCELGKNEMEAIRNLMRNAI